MPPTPVSRQVIITFDAPSAEVAEFIESALRELVMEGRLRRSTDEALGRDPVRLTNMAWSAEPTQPVDAEWSMPYASGSPGTTRV